MNTSEAADAFDAFDAFMSSGFQDLLANSISDFGAMDRATLQAIVENNESAPAPYGNPESARGLLGKRELDESDDEDGGAAGDDPRKKQRITKAEKEKARRERINRLFIDLGKLVNGGVDTDKGATEKDKTAILADAIRFIQHLTCESHQLKQVNKFLEEKVGAYERERSYYLYQQSAAGTSYPPPWMAFPHPSSQRPGDMAGPSSSSNPNGSMLGSMPNPFHHPPAGFFPPPGPAMMPPHTHHPQLGLHISIPSLGEEPNVSSLVRRGGGSAPTPGAGGPPSARLVSPFSSIPARNSLRSTMSNAQPSAPSPATDPDLDRPPAA